jgi:hypothetical protein
MAGRDERVTFQVSKEMKDALEAIAADKELSVSTYLVSTLRPILINEGYLESKKPSALASDRKM